MPTFEQADLRILNLEGALAGSSKDPQVPDIAHKLWRHSEPDQVQTLVAAGIDAVGVANNVTYPWQALMRSLEVLDEVGILYAGGGKNLDEAHKPVILEVDGVRIGFMQYAATVFPYSHAATRDRPGIAEIKVHTAYKPPRQLDKPGQPPLVITWLDEESKALMVEDIHRLREETDVVLVSFHWGVSGTFEPVSYQSDIGKAVIDAGADVVFGHGPHKYQKVEIYKGKAIFHSLAQFVFDDTLEGDRSKRLREGLLLRVVVKDKKVHSLSLVPSWREDDNLVRLYDPNTDKGRELFGYLNSVNEGGAELELRGKEIVVLGLE
jgi:poly-gamma-glutamate synthesis protein (capsule biosynthesis protein)